MADYVYCVAVTGGTMHFQCDVMELAPIMLRSLSETNDCSVLMPSFLTDEQADVMRNSFGGDLTMFPLEPEETQQLMQTKICHLAQMEFEDGDRVFVMDTDLIVQGPLFDAFDDTEFDVAQTTRHYVYDPQINNGVWCFRYNDATKAFLDYYAGQMRHPTWKPFADTMHPDPRDGISSRISDQSFMAAVYRHGSPVPCRVKDIGPMYNYCPADDMIGLGRARAEFRRVLGDPEYRVLHFKGFDIYDGKGRNIKDTMADIGRELGWI